MTTSIHTIGTAGILLALATCFGAPEASAQLFMNLSGSDNASRNQGITNNLGIGGPGSATEVQSPNQPIMGSNRGPGFSLLNQQGAKPLGVNGNPAGTSQGSLSSAADRQSSPVDSVTNSLMGPVGNLVSRSTNSAANPPAKKKQTNTAATAPSSSRGAVSQVSPSKTP